MSDPIEHLKEFEENRSSNVTSSLAKEGYGPIKLMTSEEASKLVARKQTAEEYARLHPNDLKFGFTGFIPAVEIEIALAYKCPFCLQLPHLCQAHGVRVGDNRMVSCRTVGCALYKVRIVLRIWNTRKEDIKHIWVKEDISGRRKND